MTLAVLCKKKHSKENYEVTNTEEEPDKAQEDNQQSSYNNKDLYLSDFDKEMSEMPNHNAPDVLQAVKLWYV